jgi:serine/threonine protein kinase
VLDGSYRILRVVGSGGFGVTYEAEDLKLGTTVAIKEYYPLEFADRDTRMRVRPKSERHQETFDWGRDGFLQEARTLARFDHPGIVRVLRVFEANATAYMVMRFEHGQRLEGWFDSLQRPPTQEELDSIVAPLLDALAVLHSANFLHRDIAPDNILIRTDGTPVLLDFGAARRSLAEMSHSPGGIIKTGYSPPEQYSLDGRLQGPWSDLYALGATLYRAVTGSVPEEATLRVDTDKMPPASAVLGDYRRGFLGAVDACLKVRHSERPQSVAELRQMLLEPTPNAGSEIPKVEVEPNTHVVRQPTRRYGRHTIAAGIVLLFAGSTVGIFELQRWRNSERTDNAAAVPMEIATAIKVEIEEELRRKADHERAAKEAEEARTRDEERKTEQEAEARRNREKAAAEVEAKQRAEHAALVKSLQTALNRVGCFAGEADGRWDAKERAALEQFADLTKTNLPTTEPSTVALHAVVARSTRVCPLKCGEGTILRNDTCVAKDKVAAPSVGGLVVPRAPRPEQYDPHNRNRRVTPGGYITCGRNGCQRVPAGCYAVRGAGGHGLGGKIVCP